MMNRCFQRSLALIFALGIAAAARAQYSSAELMFVYDGGDGTNAHPQKIDRYDPITRQYLGSFGVGFLPNGQVGAMTVMGKDLYFLTNNNSVGIAAVVGFNFSTGQEIYSHAIAGQGFISSMAAVNGQLVLGGYSSNTLDVLDPANNTSSMTSVSGFNEIIGLDGSGATLAVSGYAPGFAPLYGTYQMDPTDTTLTTNFVNSGDNYQSMAMSSDPSGNLRLFGAGSTANFGGVEERDASTGALMDSSGNLAQGSVWVNNSFVATGHQGEFYYLRTNNEVAVADDDLPFVLSGTGDPTIPLMDTDFGIMMTIYAAPEPAPFVVLAAGALGLLLRRRTTRQHP